MSNRDIDEAFHLLRELNGGHEPYAAHVSLTARMLRKHNCRVAYEALQPLHDLVVGAINKNPNDQNPQISCNEMIDAINKAASLRHDPELRQELLPHLPSVIPMQEENFNETPRGTIRKPHDGLLDD